MTYCQTGHPPALFQQTQYYYTSSCMCGTQLFSSFFHWVIILVLLKQLRNIFLVLQTNQIGCKILWCRTIFCRPFAKRFGNDSAKQSGRNGTFLNLSRVNFVDKYATEPSFESATIAAAADYDLIQSLLQINVMPNNRQKTDSNRPALRGVE